MTNRVDPRLMVDLQQLTFTVSGESQVEQEIRRHLSRVRDEAVHAFRAFGLSHLVLFGGYGRGEGGVQQRDGRLQPHNNYDLLLIFRGVPALLARRHLRALARRLGDRLAGELGVGVDFGVMTWYQLTRLPPAVMWYDLRHGHRLLYGDESFLRGLPDVPLAGLDRLDVLRLMTNRGVLCLINRLLLEQERELPQSDARLVIKHLAKAAIGCGDAYLFFRQRYHASYVEKGRRMEQLQAPDDAFLPELKQTYARALSFRFAPAYEEQSLAELRRRNSRLLTLFDEVHRRLEEQRTGSEPQGWMPRFEGLIDPDTGQPVSPLDMTLRRGRALLSNLRRARRLTSRPKLWFGVPPSAVLLATFPATAYDSASPAARREAARILCAPGADPHQLAKAYLELWGVHGDPNLAAALRGIEQPL